MNTLAWLGTQELIVVGVFAVLLFGRRLPEVGRYLGKGLLEFRKSLRPAAKDLDEVRDAARDAGKLGPDGPVLDVVAEVFGISAVERAGEGPGDFVIARKPG